MNMNFGSVYTKMPRTENLKPYPNLHKLSKATYQTAAGYLTISTVIDIFTL
jgi:hypothetical protein